MTFKKGDTVEVVTTHRKSQVGTVEDVRQGMRYPYTVQLQNGPTINFQEYELKFLTHNYEEGDIVRVIGNPFYAGLEGVVLVRRNDLYHIRVTSNQSYSEFSFPSENLEPVKVGTPKVETPKGKRVKVTRTYTPREPDTFIGTLESDDERYFSIRNENSGKLNFFNKLGADVVDTYEEIVELPTGQWALVLIDGTLWRRSGKGFGVGSRWANTKGQFEEESWLLQRIKLATSWRVVFEGEK
jgi:hypothetical protein